VASKVWCRQQRRKTTANKSANAIAVALGLAAGSCFASAGRWMVKHSLVAQDRAAKLNAICVPGSFEAWAAGKAEVLSQARGSTNADPA
jgi:hypothetical protein